MNHFSPFEPKPEKEPSASEANPSSPFSASGGPASQASGLPVSESVAPAPPGPALPPPSSEHPASAPGANASLPHGEETDLGSAVDPVRLAVALRQSWRRIVGAGLALGTLGLVVALLRFQTQYTATGQLIRHELSEAVRALETGEMLQSRSLSPATVVPLLESPAFLARVGNQASPPISGEGLRRALTLAASTNAELISVALRDTRSAPHAATLLSLYLTQAVRLTRELQSQQATEMDKFLRQQMGALEKDATEASQAMLAFGKE